MDALKKLFFRPPFIGLLGFVIVTAVSMLTPKDTKKQFDQEQRGAA
jgi:hypothetical protein